MFNSDTGVILLSPATDYAARSSPGLKRKKDIEQDVFSLAEMITVPSYIPLGIKKDFETSSEENCETSPSQL